MQLSHPPNIHIPESNSPCTSLTDTVFFIAAIISRNEPVRATLVIVQAHTRVVVTSKATNAV